MAITGSAVRSALRQARESGREVQVSDGGGLRIDCQPAGTGWWRWRYRIDRGRGTMSFGVYPTVGLADARRKRDEATKQIAAGSSPIDERRAKRAAAKAKAEVEQLKASGEPLPGAFEYVAREWMTEVHRAAVSDSHADRTLSRFVRDAFPWIGARPIDEIEPPELLTVLRRVTGRGAIESGHRLKDACGQGFRYGIATGVAKRNPAADLRDASPPVVSRHHAAIVDPKRAAELLRAMTEYRGGLLTQSASRLSALLILRPGELRQLEWTWIVSVRPSHVEPT